ncbi:MAG: hypothetical protein ACMVY4_17450 [Minwuia sp.]
MPTARNTGGIDLLAHDFSARQFLGIQLKALPNLNAVPPGSDLGKIIGGW